MRLIKSVFFHLCNDNFSTVNTSSVFFYCLVREFLYFIFQIFLIAEKNCGLIWDMKSFYCFKLIFEDYMTPCLILNYFVWLIKDNVNFRSFFFQKLVKLDSFRWWKRSFLKRSGWQRLYDWLRQNVYHLFCSGVD